MCLSSAKIFLKFPDAIMSVAFSQDGSQVVSGSNDNTVQIWNTMTGEVEAEL